jgi:hypothetical protein
MKEIEVFDETSLIEKIMGHFGWYKVKKVELPIENLEINHTFIMKDMKPEMPKASVRKPAAKKTIRRTKNGN